MQSRQLFSPKEKKIISEEEYINLKHQTLDAVIRDSYILSSDPEISLKIYDGRFKGLARVEVEFKSVEDATSFVPFKWMGTEITDLPLGRDSNLLDLTNQEFEKLLHSA